MSARSFAVGAAAALLLAAFPVSNLALAQDVAPQVDNAKVNFAGIVNAGNVYVRSGPGENYYATLKLDKGATVTVVGLKFDWLKVLPPEGSFSYVAKAYVEKFGDGTRGKVTKPDLNVRAGSDLNAMKTTVQSKMDQGEEVQIVGEQDEYFKIKPPQGAYLYINKQFVDPVKQLPAPVANVAKAGTPADPIASAPVLPPTVITRTPDAPTSGNNATGATVVAAVPGSTTQPAGAPPTTQGSVVEATPASTQPVAVAAPSAESKFDELEATFLDATTNLPIEKQPLNELQQNYTAVSNEPGLPASLRRIAEMRISTLKLRIDARDQFLTAKKMEDDAKARQLALKAEQEELQQRAKDMEYTSYTAIGTLRSSSLQMAGGILYRLTDPTTGRTLLYVRAIDPKYATLLGQLVGVRGEIAENTQVNLKILTPTSAEAVDVTKVGLKLTAQVMPPSLLPKAPTAFIGN